MSCRVEAKRNLRLFWEGLRLEDTFTIIDPELQPPEPIGSHASPKLVVFGVCLSQPFHGPSTLTYLVVVDGGRWSGIYSGPKLVVFQGLDPIRWGWVVTHHLFTFTSPPYLLAASSRAREHRVSHVRPLTSCPRVWSPRCQFPTGRSDCSWDFCLPCSIFTSLKRRVQLMFNHQLA